MSKQTNGDPAVGADVAAPAVLDHILAQGERHLASVAPNLPLEVTFGFGGHDFKARLDAAGDGALLRLEADLGPVPFTSENPRSRAEALARATGGQDPGLPGLCRVHKGRLKLLSRTRLPRPADGTAVLHALVVCLLEARPAFARLSGAPEAPGEPILAEAPARPAFTAERRAARR